MIGEAARGFARGIGYELARILMRKLLPLALAGGGLWLLFGGGA
jgi:hypothetical protein